MGDNDLIEVSFSVPEDIHGYVRTVRADLTDKVEDR
jgi:hypothetical protein